MGTFGSGVIRAAQTWGQVLNAPLEAQEFDHRDKGQFLALYQWAGSVDKMAAWLRREGNPRSRECLYNWRNMHGIPISHPGYRDRFEPEQVLNDTALPGRLKAYLKTCVEHQSVEQLADHFSCCPREIRDAIVELETNATLLDTDNDLVALERDLKTHEAPLAIDFSKYAETEYPLGVVADNHIGSKYERLDVLESLFDRFQSYGVQTVYQCGNIIDGEARFNKFDIYAHGVEGQVANLIEKWPRRAGIVTQFVTADDHEGWYVQREHIDVGKKIEHDAYEAGRDDLRHLGYMERDIEYRQENGSNRIRVIHAGGGSTYATSYTSQKYVESLQGGDKPPLVFVGHFHKFDYSFPRNVHIIQAGCTEDQTPFMRKRRIEAHVGGCVVWVKQNTLGLFTSVKVEWVNFYDKTFYAYRW